MRERLLRLLGSQRTYIALIILNVLVGTVTMLSVIRSGDAGNDSHSYLALANGILQGHYSQYWWLPEAFPDTFRAPGFPAYLAVVLAFTGTWRTVGVVHLALFVLSVHLTFRVMARFSFGTAARSVFLLLLLSSQNIIVYIPLVNPEVPAITCLALMLFADPLYRKPGPWTGVALGALAGFLFHCRPIFLLLPMARIIVELVTHRRQGHWRTMGLYAATFALTLVPFGLWNKQHHGVFKVTPLEGGGGVFHMGYWAGRIPDYHQHRYWGNFTADEPVRFVPADSVPANIAAYEREWDGIDSALAPLLTTGDSVMLSHYKEYATEKSFNARYTQRREALLKEKVWDHVRRTPGYYIAYKLYTAVRLWVIGVDRGMFLEADLIGRIKLAAPMVVTLGQFLLALLVVPLALWRGLLRLRDIHPMLLVVLYGWAISVPFTIQSRYTVPLRFLFFALTAMAAVALLERLRHTCSGDKEKSAP
jgi:hypothetical protein